MATYKIHKTKDYTVMSNTHLRDKNLSFKAKGLLSVMLSLPEEWDYSMNGLVAISKENLTAVRNTLTELEANRYLIRERKQNTKGQFEYEYHIYETPHTENTVTQTPHTENPHTVKPTQLSTNKSITNKSITDELSIKDKERKKESTYDDILNAVADPELKDLYIEYIKMRKMIKAPLTDRALKMLISKVNELEPHDINRQKKLLETAIINNWKSVYPLKQEQQQARPQQSNNIFLEIAQEEGIY